MSYDLSNGEKNFSMQDLANIVGQNALQMQTVISTVQSTAKEVKKISDDFDDFKAETRANIKDIRENGEIETEDVDLIKNLVHRKVIEILGLPLDVPRRKWTSEQLAYYKLYSGAVYGACYREVRAKGHFAGKTPKTRAKNLKDAIKDVESWYPAYGLETLKLKAEKDRAARIEKERLANMKADQMALARVGKA